MAHTVQTRTDLIEEVIEFLMSERSDYYYKHDVLAAFPIGDTEYAMAYEEAKARKQWARDRAWLFND